ncbi:MAG: hypothetical protein D6707_05215 [Bacteroidetes bacterium]|nr:MAG: hypothetical protein D6707_05215 [Bacteroidota bacterium]
MNFLYELPVPDINEEQKKYLVNAGFTLQYLHSEQGKFNKLKKELGVRINKGADPIELRAELEVFIAKELYGLDNDDWKYIVSTFTFGGDTETRHELDRIITASLDLL